MNEHPIPENPRRNFIYAIVAVIFGGIVSVVPVLSGLRVFFDPISKRKRGGNSQMVPVVNLSAVPLSGEPRLFPFTQVRFDAWNRYLFSGSVFIRRKSFDELAAEKKELVAKGKTNEPSLVQVLHPTCPHLGCAVSFDSGQQLFACPCHNSLFTADGKQTAQCVSLRRMDELDVVIDETNTIRIDYKNFKGSIPEKIAES